MLNQKCRLRYIKFRLHLKLISAHTHLICLGIFSGDGCIDKPLATLWKNHIGTDKPSIVMKVTVCGSGLKAVTKEHGLTEYWANRITYSAADPAYPKVFCWIYRYV